MWGTYVPLSRSWKLMEYIIHYYAQQQYARNLDV
jgi:hypothetical protein